MTTLNDRFSDIRRDHADADTARVVRDLEVLFSVTAPPETRESVALALARHKRLTRPSRRRMRPTFPRLRLVAATFAVVTGALLIVFQQHRPAAVSAETVLQRAAAPLPSNRAVHFVYRESFPGNVVRDDTWEETGPHGRITRTASTSVERTDGTVTSIDRSVDDGRMEREYEYLPLSGVVRQQSHTHAQLERMLAKASGPWSVLNVFNGPGVARKLMALRRRTPRGVHFRGLRHFGGALVYVIHVDGELHEYSQNWPAMTFYFDAHTYILRGVTGPTHPFVGLTVPRAVLIKDETLPLSAVPPHTFEFRLPKAVVVLP